MKEKPLVAGRDQRQKKKSFSKHKQEKIFFSTLIFTLAPTFLKSFQSRVVLYYLLVLFGVDFLKKEKKLRLKKEN